MLSLIIKLNEGIILEFNAPSSKINLTASCKQTNGFIGIFFYDDMTLIFCLFAIIMFLDLYNFSCCHYFNCFAI